MRRCCQLCWRWADGRMVSQVGRLQQLIERSRLIRDRATLALKIPIKSLTVFHSDPSYLEDVATLKYQRPQPGPTLNLPPSPPSPGSTLCPRPTSSTSSLSSTTVILHHGRSLDYSSLRVRCVSYGPTEHGATGTVVGPTCQVRFPLLRVRQR